VWHSDLVDGLGPERGRLQVGLFLALEGNALDGVGLGDVHVGEARDAVDYRGAAEEVRGLLFVAGFEGLRGFLLEGRCRGEERLGVFIAGGVVDVFLSG
jgi:hypothetical protein